MAQDPGPGGGGAKKKKSRSERLVDVLNPVMAAIIGIFVTGLFVWAILRSLAVIDTAPVAANTTDGTEGYSSFDRAVQVVGLVSPVLTIVLGFYFGARVGASGLEAANEVAENARAQSAAAGRALAIVESQAVQDNSIRQALDRAREQEPDAFRGQ